MYVWMWNKKLPIWLSNKNVWIAPWISKWIGNGNNFARDKHYFHNYSIKILFESFATRSFIISYIRRAGRMRHKNEYSAITQSLQIDESHSIFLVSFPFPRYARARALNSAVWVFRAVRLLLWAREPPARITNELNFAIYIRKSCRQFQFAHGGIIHARNRGGPFFIARQRTCARARAIVQSPPRICNFQAAKAAVWLPWNVSHVPISSRKFVLREIDKSSRGAYTCMCVPSTCSRATMNHS